MNNLTPTSRSKPCPVCGDIKGNCRTTKTALILCINVYDRDTTPSNWKFLGLDKSQNLWGKVVPSTEANDNFVPFHRPKQPVVLSQQTIEQRNAEIDYKLKNHRISPAHAADLERRGCPVLGYGSRLGNPADPTPQIPAFSTTNGYAVPIYNVDGLKVGAQYKHSDKSYRWVGASGTNKLIETGELPLAHWAVENPTMIALPEGTGVKPYMASSRLNAIAIGASGGHHSGSPKTLKATLDRYPNLPIVLTPDAGAILDRSVMGRYRSTVKLVRSLGRDLKVAWWEQITKDCGDIDEIDPRTEITYISWSEFEQIANSSRVKFEQIFLSNKYEVKSNKLNPDPDLLLSTSNFLLETYTTTAELEAICTNAIVNNIKYILDISVTGSGKSTRAAAIRNIPGISKYIYLTDTHRNPSTPEVETGFTDLPSRNNGLYVDLERLTAAGNPYVQTSMPNGEYALTLSNCHLAAEQNALKSKGYEIEGDNNPICGACKFAQDCASGVRPVGFPDHGTNPSKGSGMGYGYRSLRRSVLTSGRIRSSPKSLPHPSGFDYSTVTNIWDDEKITYTREITATREDFDRTIAKIGATAPRLLVAIEPIIIKLRSLFDRSIENYHGFDHTEMIDGLESIQYRSIIDEVRSILIPDLTLEQAVNLPSNWLVALLEVIQSEATSNIRFTTKLIITQSDDYHRSIVRSAKLNLFLDATQNREDLALELGCDPSEILVISQPVPTYENLTIAQVTGMGNPTKDRQASMQVRLDALQQVIATKHSQVGIIDKIKALAAGLWYRDSRGTNQYKQSDALVLIGAPVPNLGALAAQYSILTNQQISPTSQDPLWRSYINRQIASETIQAIGRLRAQHQPDKQLTVYWVCERENLPIDRIRSGFPNSQSQTVAAIDLTLEAATPSQQLHHQIASYLLKHGLVTRDALANALNISRSVITKYFHKFGRNFKVGSHLLLKALHSKCDLLGNPPGDSVLADWEQLIVTDVVELIEATLTNPAATVSEKVEMVVAIAKPLTIRQMRSVFKAIGRRLTSEFIDLLRSHLTCLVPIMMYTDNS
jgi:hypothetical protein